MPRLIFICGLHRSGTSLLENYLYANFSVSSLRGPVKENEGQFLQDVYKPAHYYGGAGKFAFSKTMQDDLRILNDYSSYATRILNSWTQYTVGTGSFLVEKSPPNITKIWWLRKVFPDAIFIVWTRDPRAVSGATLKWSKTSLEELMQHWSTAYSFAKDDIDDKTIRMRYEDFCNSPEHCLEQSGIAELLPRRPVPLDLPNRFATISNSNSEYIQLFENRIVLGGAWDSFGYDLAQQRTH